MVLAGVGDCQVLFRTVDFVLFLFSPVSFRMRFKSNLPLPTLVANDLDQAS